MNQELFAAIIARIQSRSKEQLADIQACAVWAIQQSVGENRNAANADALYQALSNSGMRRQALVKYFENHGNLCHLSVDPKTGKNCDKIGFFDVLEMTGKPAGALRPEHAGWETMPWNEATKERIVSDYDVEEQIRAILKTISNAAKSGRKILHPDLADKLRVIVAPV